MVDGSFSVHELYILIWLTPPIYLRSEDEFFHGLASWTPALKLRRRCIWQMSSISGIFALFHILKVVVLKPYIFLYMYSWIIEFPMQ